MTDPKDQQHPLWSTDRQIVNTLLKGSPTEYNLAELARLRIRYRNFPGARDIQADLDQILTEWNLTEDLLFAKTREIHQSQPVYQVRSHKRSEDWS
jgi:hypothetical protein